MSIPKGARAVLALAVGATAAAMSSSAVGPVDAEPPGPGPSSLSSDRESEIVAPGPPQDLQASALGSSEVGLTWSPPQDLISTLDHYNIYRDGTKVGEASDTTYTDTGLQSSTQYTYRVSAVNLTGEEGQKSEPDSATTPDGSPPSVPSGLSAEAAGPGSVELDWRAASDPESGIDHYNVYRDASRAGSTSATSYTDTGLEPGTAYSYRVSAVNGAGLEGEKTEPSSATTARSEDTIPPAAPTNLREVRGS